MEYEKVNRLNLEWQRDHCKQACSFDLSASPSQLVHALQVINPTKLAQLPFLAPDIGRPGKKRLAHTRLVAHLAVALVLTKQNQIDLNFGLPEHQASPRFASHSTKLVNMQLRKQLDSWLAALVEAAGNSHATRIVCSSYVLQAAARHEYSKVLGYKRLAFQSVPFQQAPRVVLHVNTDACDLTDRMVWHALRNIQCLELHFEVDRAQQHIMLQNLPAGSIHCISVSGCDLHAPGMLKALCGTLRRIRELESFQLGATAQTFSDTEERPLQEQQLACLSRSLLRCYRIVSVDFFNKSSQDEIMSMRPWCCSRFTSEQVTKSIADAAGEAARANMRGMGSVDDALPLLQGIVNFETNECSQPLAPVIVKLLSAAPPPAA